MSTQYEQLMNELSEEESPSDAARDAGADAMAFVQSLHTVFLETGMTRTPEPELDEMENLFDAMTCELAAACIFLSANEFSRAPELLRAIGHQLESSGQVPVSVAKGFERVADRIERTRVLQQALVKKSAEST
jgi:hypothetical protein